MATVVRPEIHTITLASGETLIIKKRLNTGERRDMLNGMRGSDGAFDGLISDRSTVLAYLVDWTVKDDASGQQIPVKSKDGNRVPDDEMKVILDALDPEDYKEIELAINEYDDKITATRRAEKKIQIATANANAQRAKDSVSATDGQAPSGTSSSTS